VNKNHIRSPLPENITHAVHDTRGNIKKVLIRLHEIKVEIRPYVKNFQHLVEHVAMLTRDADFGVKSRVGGKRLDHGGHLDGFWPSAEDGEDFHLYPVIIHIESILLEAVQKPFWQGALVPSMGNPILEGGV
jgi:hypothetical protein